MEEDIKLGGLYTQEMVDNHFEAYLKRNFSGKAIEAFKNSQMYEAMRATFEYGFLKGSEEAMEQVKVLLNDVKGK